MALFKRASKLDDHEYREAIRKGLNRAFADAEDPKNGGEVTVEASSLKAVVFSDLHRGAGDGADDFARCERSYAAALGWYLERGYELWLLGDIEELWENGIDEVLPRYRELLELEREFARGPGLRRFYGNHDLDWSKPQLVDRHLSGWLGDAPVREALRLRVREDGDDLGLLFLAHGHQGTATSDRFAGLSRFAVRNVWRAIQRSQGLLATTPADDSQLRHRHDVAMHSWAKERVLGGSPANRPVLIAGHTHHPVFPGSRPTRPTAEDAAELRRRLAVATGPVATSELRAQLEYVEAILREPPFEPPDDTPPCYFNSGCGSFPDRDVTCIEISGEPLVDEAFADEKRADKEDGRGKIRLMRWLDDGGEPRPKQLAADSLRSVFDKVRTAV
jgi:hypothetical protein